MLHDRSPLEREAKIRGVKRMACGLLLLLLAGAGVAWWQREPLQVWWTLRGLSRAGDADRAVWVERVGKLGEPGLTALVDSLAEADEDTCRNLLAGLNDLASAN